MAVYPCDWGVHRYPGPQRSVYVSVASDANVETHKLRLCKKHFEAELVLIREYFSVVEDESTISKTCEMCSEDRAFGIYVKVYDEKAEPVTYAADVCPTHATDLADTLHVASGRALSER